MHIKTIMSTKVVTVRPDALLAAAAQMMLWSGGRHLPVVDGDSLVGVLSEGDIFRARSYEDSERRVLVREVMTRPVKTITMSEQIHAAAGLMAKNKIGCLPVLDREKLVGIVTTTDVMRAVEREAQAENNAIEDDIGLDLLDPRAFSERLRVKMHLGGMELREAWHNLRKDIAIAELLFTSATDNAKILVRKARRGLEELLSDARNTVQK